MTTRAVIVSAVECDALRLVADAARCGGCANRACSGRQRDGATGAGQLHLPFEHLDRQLQRNIVAGDRLLISIDARKLLLLSSSVFLLPIVLMLLFCVTCGAFFSDSSTLMTTAAVLGLLLGGAVARALVNRITAGGERALLSVAGDL